MNNITFELGDPDGEGHGYFRKYHMTSNYSAKEIDNAYKQAVNLLGFDFTDEVCSGYDDNVINKDMAIILLKHSIIPEEWINKDDGIVYNIDYDTFIMIYFDIIKLILPDLIYNDRDLKEDTLFSIDGTGYGL